MKMKRLVQMFVLALLAAFAIQPGLLARMTCEEFEALAWEVGLEGCKREGHPGVHSVNCNCHEDENGQMTDGICFAVCLPIIQ